MFPTPVGMNRARSQQSYASSYVPHTRGDEPFRGASAELAQSCSPHPWG